MKNPLRNLLDLSIYKHTVDDESNLIVIEASTVLRVFLEWQFLGRPKERYDWFRSGIIVDAPAKSLIDEDALWSCNLNSDEIDEIVRELQNCFVKECGNYKWIPYIWKGIPRHPIVEKTLVDFVSNHWRVDETLAFNTLQTLFSEASDGQLAETYRDIALNATSLELRETAKNKLETHLLNRKWQGACNQVQ